MSQNVKQVDVLLAPVLGPYNQLVNYQMKPLHTGNEFKNPVYSLVAKVKDVDSHKEKTLNIVVKGFPVSRNPRALYDVEVSFKKEIGIYDKFVNAIHEFHEEYGISNKFDMLPLYYGSRLSLDPRANAPDENGVILLENLGASGFKAVDRTVGFDLQTIQTVLHDLAAFHAIPLAYRLHKPQKFKQALLPLLTPSESSTLRKFTANEEDSLRQQIVKSAVEGLPRCALLAPRITQALEAAQSHFKKPPPVNEQYATLIHNNLWLENVLIKFTGSKPIKSKFVDFKIATYDSLAKDLIFLLFSSVQKPVLDVHFDELIELYHKAFIQMLQRYECDVSAYTLQSLYSEIGRVIRTSEVLRLSFILKIVYAERGVPKNGGNFDLDKLAHHSEGQEYKRRLAETINFLADRDWI
ncbi:uncharacterized protein LOC108733522 [Agrilus planipennis]|uniref:Uncharacterized protein LOC108733522 n=1 Tax=Agrilus planipennis TaxID=224129 RepID=A0A1W4W802_AGRPL|nr:uncharacterized protein LOC108733522 [Agrilus planipennis]